MGCTYVKDFDFKKTAGDMSAKKSGYCDGGMAKKTGYAQGGVVGKEAAKVAVHKHEKSMHKGEPMTKLAKGGPATPKREMMTKREMMETPTVRRDELMQKSRLQAPARRSVPVAPQGPLIPMKTGGKVAKKC